MCKFVEECLFDNLASCTLTLLYLTFAPLRSLTIYLGPVAAVFMTPEDKCVSRGKLCSRNGGKKFPKCGVYLDILEREREREGKGKCGEIYS